VTSSQIDVPSAAFPPLSRSGVVMGLSGGQLILLAVPVVMIGAAFIGGDPAAAIGLFPFAIPVVAVATTSWKGRSLLSRIHVLGTYLLRRRLGQTRAVVDTTKPVEVGRIAVPGAVGERLKVLSLMSTRLPGAAMVWDRAEGTATAVLRFPTGGWHLTDPGTKRARVLAFDELCRNLASLDGVVRLKTHARTLPVPAATLRAGTDADVEPGREVAVVEYEELLDDPSMGMALQRDMLMTITVSKRAVESQVKAAGGGLAGMGEVLASRVQAIAAGLPACGVPVANAVWLGESELRAAVRLGFDPAATEWIAQHDGALPPDAVLASMVDETLDALVTDSGVHRTWWIEDWPRSQVPAGFLADLVGSGPFARTVTQVFVPVALHEAEKRLLRAEGSHMSVTQRNERLGRPPSSTHVAEERDLVARRDELAEGYGDVRFTGYVTVSGADEAALASAHTWLVAHGTRLHFNPLRGQQYTAFLTSALPLGLGPRA